MAEGRLSRLNAFCVKDAAGKVLARVKAASPLKDWARRIRKRSGHGQACLALARKLAVITHRMPITGGVFRWSEQGKTATP